MSTILPNAGTGEPLPDHCPDAPETTQSGKGWNGVRAYELYSAQNRFLLGKVLTTVDAAIPNEKQGKAVKDIIKQQFHDQERHVYNITSDGGQLVSGVDGKLEV